MKAHENRRHIDEMAYVQSAVELWKENQQFIYCNMVKMGYISIAFYSLY